MKRFYLYTALLTALAACSSDAPALPGAGESDLYAMNFQAVACGVGPDSRLGIYKADTYPGKKLYLTAYLTDDVNHRQYYFTDMLLDYDDTAKVWKATDWYWPLQGKMSFLSYWCSGFSKAPEFDEIVDADGNTMARMVVDATKLDGRTDFLYLSTTGVPCPQIGTKKLQFMHGLAWITITMKAEVLDAGGTGVDGTKTTELINHLSVNKVVIEDCARKGLATVIPGGGITWKTYDDRESETVSYIRDQVYTKKFNSAYLTSFPWEEYLDASEVHPAEPLPKLTTEPQTLGLYAPEDDQYAYGGLLIVPQNKTAITIDYTITDKNNYQVHKVERYELRDNSIAWLPGYHYNYDIVFRNYNDYDSNFEVIPSWSGIVLSDENYCYDSSVFGTMSSDSDTDFNTGFVIEPVHDGGSGMDDDMDYPEGPRVF